MLQEVVRTYDIISHHISYIRSLVFLARESQRVNSHAKKKKQTLQRKVNVAQPPAVSGAPSEGALSWEMYDI